MPSLSNLDLPLLCILTSECMLDLHGQKLLKTILNNQKHTIFIKRLRGSRANMNKI